jgi:hypothetical protein
MRSKVFYLASLAIVAGLVAACSALPEATRVTTPSMAAPGPDPREGLRAGLRDPGVASWNLRLLSNTPPPPAFQGVTNSDLAFTGRYAIQGNYNGYQVWDISDPEQPTLETAYVCPASQSDVSVYRNLLFVSGEGLSGRLDCGTQGVPDTVSAERLRGIRIFDITDIARPRYIANVQTCRGSHTHTVVNDPKDNDNVYLYVSGSASVRSPRELPGCSGLSPRDDPNSALFRIEVIKVPLAAPEQASILSSPRIFYDLAAPPKHGELSRDTAAAPSPPRERTGPTQCHDITVYPEIGLAGGACEGYGLLLDIRDVANPKRITAVADSNFSYWHSATFSNDGSKVLFTDEWGGGGAPRCRATDKPEWGANAIFTRTGSELTFASYYKLPAVQTSFENCVAHNGSPIPIPGRDVMVQAWYQGGISIFDWTDPAQPREIAFFDRGPVDSTRVASGGSWSAYWYNGHIVSSEISRGLDILELLPNALISQNEIDAAKTVTFDEFNPQHQQRPVWPATFALARAYLDQLARSGGLVQDRVAEIRKELARAEMLSHERRAVLTQLAAQVSNDAKSARDAAKVQLLAEAVSALADTQS